MKEDAKTFRLAMVSALAALLLSLLLSGCQAKPPKISIRDARVEFSQDMRNAASVFLRISNQGGADTLLGAQVNIPGAKADIHEMSGMVMIIADKFDIPAGAEVDFRSGASHIMIMNLLPDVQQGSTFILTLNFAKSGHMAVPLTFSTPRPQPRMESKGQGTMHMGDQ